MRQEARILRQKRGNLDEKSLLERMAKQEEIGRGAKGKDEDAAADSEMEEEEPVEDDEDDNDYNLNYFDPGDEYLDGDDDDDDGGAGGGGDGK